MTRDNPEMMTGLDIWLEFFPFSEISHTLQCSNETLPARKKKISKAELLRFFGYLYYDVKFIASPVAETTSAAEVWVPSRAQTSASNLEWPGQQQVRDHLTTPQVWQDSKRRRLPLATNSPF